MNNRTSVALLGAIAAALHSAEAFAPTTSLRLRLSPTTTGDCRCRSTEASLFRRKKKNVAVNELGPSTPHGEKDEEPEQLQNSRRSFLSATAAVTAATASLPLRAYASTSTSSDKQLNLSNDELKQIILSDVVDKSFLVSADITRSVYDESATFTDEIDVYTMDKWIKGTKSLFIPSGSRVSLVGDVEVTQTEVSFRFDEDLMFNIPFKPVCSLTGKMVLTRDENTGLITSYREYWDQSVNDVLKTAKFGKKSV
mmetsp:Transcript_7084/g.12698  ORF Transcript_7084/g.12698 Transcript_7084/m.12698 type:complete len:254 (-) Transcript_7084:119-880(-)